LETEHEERVATSALLSGFGRGPASRANLHRPTSSKELHDLVAELGASGTPLLGRGLGRAYGDAAQSGGGNVIDMTGLDRVLELDAGRAVARAEAGLSLDALLRESVPRGLFVPVTPGTRHVTLGGAVAADVHGKNHHRDGSIGRHVRELNLLTPDGPRRLGPDREPEAFWATVGAMGLTGIVSEVEVQMTPIESAYMRVDTDRAKDLESCMTLLAEGDDRYRYSVAWIDCLAGGSSLGRSVLTRGEHALAGELTGAHADAPLDYAPRGPVTVPRALPACPLNALSGRVLNELWYRKAPRHREGEIQPLSTFFYPLDGIGDWNLLYGPRGFTQYQLVVPFGAEEVIAAVLETLQREHQAVFLGVLKRFGEESPAPLSFPKPGWTLALDLALGRPGLSETLDRIDELVLLASGRVYLAKDGRLSAQRFCAMYPRLEQWREQADRLDPRRQLVSDLSSRLHLRDPKTVGAQL
jgi:decaprenylphospho-beta-D-ribofuranose 2-oxidase